MPREITLTTGARLHFGPLSYAPDAARHFGGVGAMIDAPGFVVSVSRAERDECAGAGESASRARAFVAAYRERCPRDQQPPPCRVEVRDEIPAHAGLGSGTQLGMAIAQALSLLGGARGFGPEFLVSRVGRGARSAIGCHGFERGGLLVDGGKQPQSPIGALVARQELNPDWRFLLVTPRDAGGLAGAAENAAFSWLRPMPQATTDRLCRLVLTDLLPSVVESDCRACGEALYEYGRLVGDYFAPVQGGTYALAGMRELVEHLRQEGVHGVGQTSWGPTIFALLEDAAAAEQIQRDVSRDPRWSGCDLRIAAPLNTGAAIEIR